MSKEDELRDILNHTAQDLNRLADNPRTWLSWMIYLLDQLEDLANDADSLRKDSYRDMLSALEDSIRTRLRTGGW